MTEKPTLPDWLRDVARQTEGATVALIYYPEVDRWAVETQSALSSRCSP